MKQFDYSSNDCLDFDINVINGAKIIAAILTIEVESPGTLNHVLRLMALVADDWVITTKSSDPIRAIKVQKELESWLSSDSN